MMDARPSKSGPILRRKQGGFSLLETAIALVVAGLMSWAAFSGYEVIAAQKNMERARAEAQQLRTVVRAFAMRHGRLPCPSADAANGYESLVSGSCASGRQVGWFPYVSAGLEVPEDGMRARYAVFRDANVDVTKDADLATSKERTGDAAGSTTFHHATDLVAALNTASLLSFSDERPYLTGDGGVAGAMDCAANHVMAVAYWIMIDLQDKDGDGLRLDLPHKENTPCAVSPFAVNRLDFDDVVEAESHVQLAGWLRKSLP